MLIVIWSVHFIILCVNVIVWDAWMSCIRWIMCVNLSRKNRRDLFYLNGHHLAMIISLIVRTKQLGSKWLLTITREVGQYQVSNRGAIGLIYGRINATIEATGQCPIYHIVYLKKNLNTMKNVPFSGKDDLANDDNVYIKIISHIFW